MTVHTKSWIIAHEMSFHMVGLLLNKICNCKNIKEVNIIDSTTDYRTVYIIDITEKLQAYTRTEEKY